MSQDVRPFFRLFKPEMKVSAEMHRTVSRDISQGVIFDGENFPAAEFFPAGIFTCACIFRGDRID